MSNLFHHNIEQFMQTMADVLDNFPLWLKRRENKIDTRAWFNELKNLITKRIQFEMNDKKRRWTSENPLQVLMETYSKRIPA